MYHRAMFLRIALVIALVPVALASAQDASTPQGTAARAEFDPAEEHYHAERWNLAAQSY